MSLCYLILQEIRHRWGHFLLALCAVMLAVTCLLGSQLLLQHFDQTTETITTEKQSDLEAQIAAMEDEFRQITKRMGFNILILPQDQDLTDFYAENYADRTMPEAYATTLANAPDIVTIRHLLPMLQAKIEWPEQKRKILLIGVKGEMPWAHRNNLKPIQEPVDPSTVVVGYELHRSLSLQPGDTLTLLGQEFTVATLHPERGTIDDITLWIDLQQAQQLLKQEGRISAMTALECKCAWADLPKVRREIQAILPDTQVIELAGKALARAEARNEATQNAQLLLEREKQSRADLRQERENLFALLVPLVVAACTLLVGILTFLNARERRIEIGIHRACGFKTYQILTIFLGKAIILGIMGAALGLGLTHLLSQCSATTAVTPPRTLIVGILLLTPLVTLVAGWIPALLATRQDPAQILAEE